jgi:hypothetical protein
MRGPTIWTELIRVTTIRVLDHVIDLQNNALEISESGAIRATEMRSNGLLGGSRMATPPQYDSDRADGSKIDRASGQQPSFASPLRTTLNTVPAYPWYAVPSGTLTFANEKRLESGQRVTELGLPAKRPSEYETLEENTAGSSAASNSPSKRWDVAVLDRDKPRQFAFRAVRTATVSPRLAR